MTERPFLADSHLLDFGATVVARREHEGRPAVPMVALLTPQVPARLRP